MEHNSREDNKVDNRRGRTTEDNRGDNRTTAYGGDCMFIFESVCWWYK
ncbi:hypothetical protein Hamer_G019358 [Homarus americanus]|uniref:Uncharacterized protein n=1 Tax=Homarus americanus TaxID=6706 RepID=A0A8J5JQY0_HOMAM|nr:hypothetical protein Hamer_G019358 [Homarus americanus]